MKKPLKILLTVAIFVGILPFFVRAQVPTPGTVLSLSSIPTQPSPNTSVTVKAENFVVDLNRSRISWFVNGTLVADAIGKTSVQVTVGGVGSRTLVTAFAEGPNGEVLNGAISFSAGDVTILWESDSYVPPMYKGKALHGFGGNITFVAFPDMVGADGSHSTQENTVYTWRLNNRVIASKSGYGKYKMTLAGSSLGRDEDVSVTAETRDGSVSVKKSITVRPVRAFLEIYESDPLSGIHFERAVSGTLTTGEDEVTMTAYPFFLSLKSRNDSLSSVVWRVGGDTVSQNDEGERGILTLRPDENARGVASVGVTINNLANILQEATRTFRVQFE